jgi:hypothetical protein
MVKLKITNPDLSGEEQTYLTADHSSEVTTLYVRASREFTSGWYAVLGEPGQENTENVLITNAALSDITMTSGVTKYAHPKSTSVYRSQFNQVSLERKPSGGSYATVSGSPFNIEWDNADKKTFIAVSAGVTSDTYRWRFYNANSTEYSDYSDELVGTGLTRIQVGTIIELVKRNPVAQNIDEQFLIDYANEYQNFVYDEIPKAWWFTKEGTAVATVADTYKYSITANWSDFLSMRFMLYRYISGTNIDETYPLSFVPPQEFYNLKADANQSSDDGVRYWTLIPPDGSSAKGYIGLHPTPDTTACYLKPVYFFELDTLNSFGDSIVVPYPKGYVDYILYRIYDDIKSDTANADKFNARVQRSITALKRRARRQLGQPELFRFRGQRGWSRQFGSGGLVDFQTQKELYF